MSLTATVTLTALGLAHLLLFALAAWDAYTYVQFGSRTTISRIWQRVILSHPWTVGVLFSGFLLGGYILGHIQWPQAPTPEHCRHWCEDHP